MYYIPGKNGIVDDRSKDLRGDTGQTEIVSSTCSCRTVTPQIHLLLLLLFGVSIECSSSYVHSNKVLTYKFGSISAV